MISRWSLGYRGKGSAQSSIYDVGICFLPAGLAPSRLPDDDDKSPCEQFERRSCTITVHGTGYRARCVNSIDNDRSKLLFLVRPAAFHREKRALAAYYVMLTEPVTMTTARQSRDGKHPRAFHACERQAKWRTWSRSEK